MKLNLFNTVNNKERGRGQRSVVWLKRSQPCLHHLHVLSTTFSWRPLSSFSLWIILLPFHSRCFAVQSSRFFLRCLGLRLAFVQSLFPRNLGRQSWRDVRLCVLRCFFLLGCFVCNFMVRKGDNSFGGGVFARRSDCGFAFTRSPVQLFTNVAVKRSTSLAGQAVHELSS